MVAQPTTADRPPIAVQVEGPSQESPEDAVVLRSLSYAYAGHRPMLSDISLSLPRGSRCLLVGANGAGAHQRLTPPCVACSVGACSQLGCMLGPLLMALVIQPGMHVVPGVACLHLPNVTGKIFAARYC